MRMIGPDGNVGPTLVVLLFGASAAIASPVVSNGKEPLSLIVRTYPTVRISARVLDRARAAAETAYKRAGVVLLWRTCLSTGEVQPLLVDPCRDELGRMEIIIRIVPATSQIAAGALGESVVDVAQRDGSFATVYLDRVESVARSARIDIGLLLGRTMAHEIGHLLLGTSEHSVEGLMRARWSAEELTRNRPADWTFSTEQRGTIVEHLRKRAITQEAPLILATGGHDDRAGRSN
jgi:hypothetical protein